MVTLELEYDKVHVTPAIINNESNNEQNANGNHNNIIISSRNNDHIVRHLSLYTIFQVIGILLVLAVLCWLQIYRNGFGVIEIEKLCNWHPLLMTIAFIYLLSNSILHFRNFRNDKKLVLKIQHTIIHTSIIIIGIFGIWTGLNSNSIANPPVPKFYSLHSWLGIVTVVMFLFQFASGFLSFLYPGIAIKYKEAIMPYHLYFGILIYILSVITTVLGFNEKIMFALNQQFKHWPTEILVLNFLGITVILYSVLVVYILLIIPKNIIRDDT